MNELRKKQQDDAPDFYGRLTEIADDFWRTAQSAQAETLRGGRVYANAVSLQVFPNEIQRARMRRALETMFQVQFADQDLEWQGRGRDGGGALFIFTAPFDVRLGMTRSTLVTAAQEPQTEDMSVNDMLNYERPAVIHETYEHFQLVSYSRPGWEAYLERAEGRMLYTSIRDMMARAPDRDAVLDMVSAILISSDDRPRLSVRPGATKPVRAPRGIRIRD
jgi:hypothetical protein